MAIYSDRRRVEVQRRDRDWLDLQPLVKKKSANQVLYPIRQDDKTVIWVPACRLAKYFPLPFRSETPEQYMEKYHSDPKKFAY